MSAVPQIRNREKTRSKIVAAARAEFAAKGYAGARMAQIAQRARVNKELIYHYFSGKEQLFEEVRSQQLAEAQAGRLFPPNPLHDASPQPAELFAWRFKRMLGDREWLKLLTWEAAQNDVPPNAKARRTTIQEAVGLIEKAQKQSLVPAGLDARLLQLAVFALANYPLAFSQITLMTTGMSASDKRFQAAWTSFLRELGMRLLTPAAAHSAHRRAVTRRRQHETTPESKKRSRGKRAVSGESK